MDTQSPNLANLRILLGITGGIAAYKSAELVRLLRDAGAEVKVVMTQGALDFITPVTLQALSEHRVFQPHIDTETQDAMAHIELARWANLVLVAPATANFLAKAATGLADDVLSTSCLATTATLMIAPAMNKQMWEHPATQANLQLIQARGAYILGPAEGVQACGDIGFGRMLEPKDILAAIAHFQHQPKRLSGQKVIVTAGPTQEAIDPVRYISNQSSGKMGYAIAAAAAREGAEVLLISGPTALPSPVGVQRLNVISAQDMYKAVMSHMANCNIFIGAAAVADYRLETVSSQKIKKSSDTLQLTLVRNPDILADVARLSARPLVVGFAAETNDVVKNAKQKLQQKQLDIIVANEVGEGKGFNSDENELIIVTSKYIIGLPKAAKQQLAEDVINFIVEYLSQKSVVTVN